jgi:Beta-lactamase enzyme family
MKLCLVITLCLVLICFTPQPTQADSHRTSTDPTAWWWFYGQSGADITNTINTNGARLIDIEIQSTNPLLFTAAYVHNSGVYAETWWWYYGMTPADISVALDRNNARLIDIERYDSVGAGSLYAVIMVENSGADAKNWWWYYGVDDAFLSGIVDENNARMVDLESYQDGGTKYAAIMIENTGSDASPWWWYFNAPASTIINNINTNGSRVLEFQARDPVAGTFDAILIPNDGATAINWWWYYGVTESQVNAFVNQNGARITDLDTYVDGLQRKFSVVMVNNSNELTTKMGNLLAYGDDGATGAYLKVVDGPVLASLQPNFVYEPASSIKVTHHLYTMREVMFGNDNLAAELIVAEGLDFSCPNGGPPFNSQTLEETLQGMMQNSDNTDTEAIAQRFGTAAINNMSAAVVGMTSTSINHPPGCPWPPLNEMTLMDSGLLYEGVATGLYLDPVTREDFYRLMQSETTSNPWWFTNNLEDMIHEVAAGLGHPEMAADYWNNTRLAWKPGGDTLNDGVTHVYRAVSGWVSLPLCPAGAAMGSKEYVFGLFVHDANNEGYADTRLGLTAELFRDEIAAGLISCLTPVSDQPDPFTGRMLRATHPNPFNPRTSIGFTVNRPQRITITVYDMTGRRVVVLVDDFVGVGDHNVEWNGANADGRAVGSGAYLVRLQNAEAVESQKIMLVR